MNPVRTRVMGALMPRPSDVAENFYGLESVDGSEVLGQHGDRALLDALVVTLAAFGRVVGPREAIACHLFKV